MADDATLVGLTQRGIAKVELLKPERVADDLRLCFQSIKQIGML